MDQKGEGGATRLDWTGGGGGGNGLDTDMNDLSTNNTGGKFLPSRGGKIVDHARGEGGGTSQHHHVKGKKKKEECRLREERKKKRQAFAGEKNAAVPGGGGACPTGRQIAVQGKEKGAKIITREGESPPRGGELGTSQKKKTLWEPEGGKGGKERWSALSKLKEKRAPVKFVGGGRS